MLGRKEKYWTQIDFLLYIFAYRYCFKKGKFGVIIIAIWLLVTYLMETWECVSYGKNQQKKPPMNDQNLTGVILRCHYGGKKHNKNFIAVVLSQIKITRW